MNILGSCAKICQHHQETWKTSKKMFIQASKMWLTPRGTSGTVLTHWRRQSTSCLQSWTNEAGHSGIQHSCLMLKDVLARLCPPCNLCLGFLEPICYCNQAVERHWMLESSLTASLDCHFVKVCGSCFTGTNSILSSQVIHYHLLNSIHSSYLLVIIL